MYPAHMGCPRIRRAAGPGRWCVCVLIKMKNPIKGDIVGGMVRRRMDFENCDLDRTST